jgi:hypothetical protein
MSSVNLPIVGSVHIPFTDVASQEAYDSFTERLKGMLDRNEIDETTYNQMIGQLDFQKLSAKQDLAAAQAKQKGFSLSNPLGFLDSVTDFLKNAVVLLLIAGLIGLVVYKKVSKAAS